MFDDYSYMKAMGPSMALAFVIGICVIVYEWVMRILTWISIHRWWIIGALMLIASMVVIKRVKIRKRRRANRYQPTI